MTNEDMKEFRALMKAALEYYDKEATPTAIQIYWHALKAYPIEVIKEILNTHIQTSKFMPKVSEVLDVLRAMDGRPEPQEAWAIVAKSLNDENVTIVRTVDMARAFGVALGLQDDTVAARMAFIEAYRSEVAQARAAGVLCVWEASLGHDPYGREGPLLEAVRDGKLTAPHVAALLPYRDDPSPQVKQLLSSVKFLEEKPSGTLQ